MKPGRYRNGFRVLLWKTWPIWDLKPNHLWLNESKTLQQGVHFVGSLSRVLLVCNSSILLSLCRNRMFNNPKWVHYYTSCRHYALNLYSTCHYLHSLCLPLSHCNLSFFFSPPRDATNKLQNKVGQKIWLSGKAKRDTVTDESSNQWCLLSTTRQLPFFHSCGNHDQRAAEERRQRGWEEEGKAAVWYVCYWSAALILI